MAADEQQGSHDSLLAQIMYAGMTDRAFCDVGFYKTMNQYEELLAAIRGASALVKIMMGPANNAAWTVCLHAHDKAKTLPQYRHDVKRAFRQALDAWRHTSGSCCMTSATASSA